MHDWSAAQYLKFEDERSRPVQDLITRIPIVPHKIIDIGCGPGNSTELLFQHWPQAELFGFDNSPDMIRKAQERVPEAEFYRSDIHSFNPDQSIDLLFSNAVFQWLPDHMSELQRLINELKSGAALAVQMPDNLGEPMHVAMRELSAEGEWKEKLSGIARNPLPSVTEYYNALSPQASSLDIWHVIYNHTMDSVDAIVEWVKGAALRPFLEPLNEQETVSFLQAYKERLKQTYPLTSDGKVLLRFPRLFIVAVRK